MANAPVIIITGASRGIGAWVARRLARSGASVALTARSADKLSAVSEAVRSLGGTPLSMPADLGDEAAASRIVTRTLERFGRIDALVNNAGTVEPVAPVADADPDQWQRNIQVNLLAPFLLTREALPALRASCGRVINISSGAAVKAVSGWSAYCTAKAGLTHFTRVLAAEETAVTALSVRPGVVDTAMQEKIRTRGARGMTPEGHGLFVALKSENRLEHPRVPARSVAWLSVYAPLAWSGEFIEYDDPRVIRGIGEKWGSR